MIQSAIVVSALLCATPTADELVALLRANTQYAPPPLRFEARVERVHVWEGWNVSLPADTEGRFPVTAIFGDETAATILYSDNKQGVIKTDAVIVDLADGTRERRETSSRRVWYAALAASDRRPSRSLNVEALVPEFHADGRDLADHLETADDVVIGEDLEKVDGHACLKVSFSNAYGQFTMWLDPERSFLMRKARVLKTKDHVAMSDARPFTEAFVVGLPSGEGWEYVRGEAVETWLDDVVIERIGSHDLVTAAKVIQETRYEGNRIHRETEILELGEIELDPAPDVLSEFSS